MSYGDLAAPSGPRAGFGQRLAAYLIDVAPLLGVTAILELKLGTLGDTLGLMLFLGYFTYFEGNTGQTLGKRTLGIRVVDFETGASIGHGRALARSISRYLSGAVLALGYLWMLWDRERQTWHDKLAGSVVVPISAYPVGYHAGGESSVRQRS